MDPYVKIALNDPLVSTPPRRLPPLCSSSRPNPANPQATAHEPTQALTTPAPLPSHS